MKKLNMDDLRPIADYELDRDTFRKRVVEHKNRRRVNVGPTIAIMFEDRLTMTFQIQEMMRAESMVDDAPILEELAVYNTLIPDAGELSATLFIEITQKQQIKAQLRRFIGLTSGDKLWLQIGDERIWAEFEQGRSTEDQISSVHYIKFKVPTGAIEALAQEETTVELSIAQGDYQHTILLGATIRESLLTDLKSE